MKNAKKEKCQNKCTHYLKPTNRYENSICPINTQAINLLVLATCHKKN